MCYGDDCYTVHRVLQYQWYTQARTHTHTSCLFEVVVHIPRSSSAVSASFKRRDARRSPYTRVQSKLSSQSMTFIRFRLVNSPPALHWNWVSGSEHVDPVQEHQKPFLIQDRFSLWVSLFTFVMRLQIRRREHTHRCCAPGWTTWGSPWVRERERHESSAHIQRTNKQIMNK